MRPALLLSLAFALLFSPRPAHAEPPPAAPSVLAPIDARLDFARGPGAEPCPGESALRSSVAAGVARDPFVTSAPRRLVVRLTRKGDGFAATMVIREDSGGVTWAPPPMRGPDCRGLVRAIGIAIAIKLDPPQAARPAPALPAPVIVVAPPVRPPAPPPPDARSPASARPKIRAGVGAAVDLGLVPAAAAALSAQAGVRWPLFSISAEGRGVLPVTVNVGTRGQQARISAVAGSLVPCGHIPLPGPLDKWNLAACGALTLGAVHNEPVGFERPAGGRSFYATTGARIHLEMHVGGPVLLRVGGDLSAVLRPIVLQFSADQNDGQIAWTGGRVTGAVGGGVVADF